MTPMQRQSLLSQTAGNDAAYRIWKSCYEEYAPQFEAFANTQPENIRSILWGYAESGRLMYQRMVNLACEGMIFPDETE